MGIRVRATQRGFYGQLRESGDVFEIESDKHFAASEFSYGAYGNLAEAPLNGWMEKVDDDVGSSSDDSPRAVEPHDPAPKRTDPFSRAAGKSKGSF